MIEPESDIGNIEYKLKLLKTDNQRIENLATQMRFRCQEGNGECIYVLGVQDDGRLEGITDEEYKETLDHINMIAHKNNYSVKILSTTNVDKNKNIYEVLVREINDDKYIDIKIAVAGNVDGGKCVGFNTPIIMYDGKIKMVQNIKEGDLLMGDDSTPRTVLKTTTGKGVLYKIVPLNGDIYKFNKNHILCFKVSCHDTVSFDKSRNRFKIRWMELVDNIPVIKEKRTPIEFSKIESENELKNIEKLKGGDIIELTFEQYINLPTNTQNALKLYKTGIEFPEKELPIDPYMIGYWLGDGTSTDSEITTQDSTTVKYFKTNLEKYKCYLQYRNNKGTNKYKYRINGNGTIGGNFFLTTLKNLNLINNKHIPDIYKYNSRENRLKLLAGLLDSDVSYSKRNIFEFTQSLEHGQLMDDIVYLCRSLGFACYKNKKNTSWTHKGVKKTGEAWRMNIMGEDIENIPTLCPRKKANKRKSPKNVLVTAIDKITTTNKEEKYYGFELDGNGRFLLGDFSVTHNSSIIGCLTTGIKDNGRGLSRSYVFNFAHELKSGRTSSIAHQILGFDYEGKVVNYQGINKLSWGEIVKKSAKIISFLDLCGHEKYIRTTILGLTSSFPDICMIMIDANNGVKPMTKEHIFLCVTLKIPFIIVVSKIDICKDRQNILKETMQSINKFLNCPGIRRIPLQIKNKDDIILSAKNIYSDSVTPIFKISCVTEEGLDDLKLFFNIVSKKPDMRVENNNEMVEYHIDHIFNVHGFGTVLGGHLIKGTISVGDKLLIGPHSGFYDNVTIRSIYCKKMPLQKVSCGSYVCLGIKKADKNNIKRGNVIICNKNEKLMVKRFVAEISILRTHSTTVRVGYEPVLNAYSIRQASKIVEILEKQNLRKCEDDDGCLRNGDVAKVVLEFKYHCEFLREGTRFILSEGKTKIVGQVISL
jgi:GTPase